jgi:hypothetical protein
MSAALSIEIDWFDWQSALVQDLILNVSLGQGISRFQHDLHISIGSPVHAKVGMNLSSIAFASTAGVGHFCAHVISDLSHTSKMKRVLVRKRNITTHLFVCSVEACWKADRYAMLLLLLVVDFSATRIQEKTLSWIRDELVQIEHDDAEVDKTQTHGRSQNSAAEEDVPVTSTSSSTSFCLVTQGACLLKCDMAVTANPRLAYRSATA